MRSFAEAQALAKNRMRGDRAQIGFKTPCHHRAALNQIRNRRKPVTYSGAMKCPTHMEYLQVDEGHPVRGHDIPPMRRHNERQRRGSRHRRSHGPKTGVTVTYMPAMIRIDGEGKIEFKMSEISRSPGPRDDTLYVRDLTSTHYGRMVMVDDDTVVLLRRYERGAGVHRTRSKLGPAHAPAQLPALSHRTIRIK